MAIHVVFNSRFSNFTNPNKNENYSYTFEDLQKEHLEALVLISPFLLNFIMIYIWSTSS